MKIAINTRPVDGPWGGGNRFVQSVTAALEQRGHSVEFSLKPNLDIILIIDPRSRNPLLSFTPGQALAYIRSYPDAIVVHRINECDERKGTRTMNARLRLANYAADHTVFIASWLADLNVWRRESSMSVILNGADEAIFHRDSARVWNGQEPLRLVTHHWGANANKGFDVYRQLDALLGADEWRDRLRFTYIGNCPPDAGLSHANVQAPLNGRALASALAEHHVYITASINEPAGMHHVEAALIGLPLLYRQSGALPEYCAGFGESFEGPVEFEAALTRMMQKYSKWRAGMAAYPHAASKMTSAYVALFEQLHADRKLIAARRRVWRDPFSALAIRIPL